MSEDRTVVANTDPDAAPEAEPTQLAVDVAPAPAADVTQQAVTTSCPVCETENLPGDTYCQDCGFLLGSASVVEALPDLSTVPHLVATDAAGNEYPLNEGANGVGRESGEVLLSDLTVSRDHAAVILEEGRVFVEDHGSTNGSRVAEQRLAAGQRVEVFEGDEVRFGNVRLRMVIPSGEKRPEGSLPEPVAETPAIEEAPVDRGAPVAELTLKDGTAFPLYAGVNSIGRRSANDIAISTDPFLSGNHAEIRCEEDGGVILVDIGSTNGTFLDDARISANDPQAISADSVLRFGKTPARLRMLEAEEAAPAASETEEPAPEPEAAEEEAETVEGATADNAEVDQAAEPTEG